MSKGAENKILLIIVFLTFLGYHESISDGFTGTLIVIEIIHRSWPFGSTRCGSFA